MFGSFKYKSRFVLSRWQMSQLSNDYKNPTKTYSLDRGEALLVIKNDFSFLILLFCKSY